MFSALKTRHTLDRYVQAEERNCNKNPIFELIEKTKRTSEKISFNINNRDCFFLV